MGYMGFGMQKWIYTQRPRKPFSKQRRDAVDVHERYSVNETNISGRTRISPTDQDIKLVLDRIRKNSIKGKLINLLLAIAFIVLSVVILIKFEPWKSHKRSEHALMEEQKQALEEKIEIFNTFLAYGKYHLDKGETGMAIQEFHKCLDVFPDNMEALEYLTKTYMLNCVSMEIDCEEAMVYIDKLIEKDPDNMDYMSYRISIENK